MCWSCTTLYLSFDLRKASDEPEAVSSVARRRRVEASVNGRVPSKLRRSSTISQQTVGVRVYFRSKIIAPERIPASRINEYISALLKDRATSPAVFFR